MSKMTPDELAWHKRIESMLETDIRIAEKILAEHGFTPAQALAAVKTVSASGVWLQFHPGAPKELQDPTN